MTNKIISLESRRPLDDLEVMARFCNSPKQQMRREERREAAAMKKKASAACVVFATFASGFAVGFAAALCAFFM